MLASSDVRLSPLANIVSAPPLQAYSHSASVGNRNECRCPHSSGRADNLRQNSAASSHDTESTGKQPTSIPATDSFPSPVGEKYDGFLSITLEKSLCVIGQTDIRNELTTTSWSGISFRRSNGEQPVEPIAKRPLGIRTNSMPDILCLIDSIPRGWDRTVGQGTIYPRIPTQTGTDAAVTYTYSGNRT